MLQHLPASLPVGYVREHAILFPYLLAILLVLLPGSAKYSQVEIKQEVGIWQGLWQMLSGGQNQLRNMCYFSSRHAQFRQPCTCKRRTLHLVILAGWVVNRVVVENGKLKSAGLRYRSQLLESKLKQVSEVL